MPALTITKGMTCSSDNKVLYKQIITYIIFLKIYQGVALGPAVVQLCIK